MIPGLYYLATPYSKYPKGIEEAFKEACRVAATLIADGLHVFSPIAHSHPIAIHGNLDAYGYETWLALDEAIMRGCVGLIVARMEGWETSYGVNWEINWFKENKGVEPIYIDP